MMSHLQNLIVHHVLNQLYGDVKNVDYLLGYTHVLFVDMKHHDKVILDGQS